jgi:hypothetical protein
MGQAPSRPLILQASNGVCSEPVPFSHREGVGSRFRGMPSPVGTTSLATANPPAAHHADSRFSWAALPLVRLDRLLARPLGNAADVRVLVKSCLRIRFAGVAGLL